jgi:general secretion pathway protein E
VGIYEIVTLDEPFKRLVRQDCDLSALRRQAVKQGMRPLRLSAAQKVADGLTTAEECLKVVPRIDLD